MAKKKTPGTPGMGNSAYAEAMRELRPELYCIGFSSVPTYKSAFLEAGAIGFVRKSQQDPWEYAREAAALWNARS